MTALACATQQIDGASGHHLAAVLDEELQHFLQIQDSGLAAHQRDAVDAEHALQLRLRVEVVQHHLTGLPTAKLDHHAQPILVGLVTQLRDAFDLLVLHELCDPLDHARLVQLIRNLGDDDRLAAVLCVDLDMCLAPHVDPATPGAIGENDARPPVDDATRREIRALHIFHELVDGDLRPLDQRHAGPDHLPQVVRWDVRCHAHRDTRRAIHQQVGYLGGQDRGHGQRLVIIRDKVHRLAIEVLEELLRDPRHAHLGVALRGGGIAVHGTEISLSVDQGIAHGEVLGEAHDGVVDGAVAVWVIFTDHLSHHSCGLHVGTVERVVELAHRH